jgi:surface protein
MIRDMSGLFFDARAFNGDISKWDVSSVTSMDAMFYRATAFNGDISKWDVSKVIYIQSMFLEATAFNGDISEWDVSSVTTMQYMFYGASTYNGDISEWDVSSVTNMDFMFYRATAFEHTLCWDLMSESQTDSMFVGSPGGLDPKCGKYIATTVDTLGRLHRLPLQFIKRESPDPDAYDDNEIETVPLSDVSHLPPFLHAMPRRYGFRGFGSMGGETRSSTSSGYDPFSRSS